MSKERYQQIKDLVSKYLLAAIVFGSLTWPVGSVILKIFFFLLVPLGCLITTCAAYYHLDQKDRFEFFKLIGEILASSALIMYLYQNLMSQ